MRPVDIYITVDTEAWPRSTQWRERRLSDDIDRDVYGLTEAGEYGIRFQMERLRFHGLKAVFLVEALFACAVGLEPLAQIVREIQSRGHEVQLHAHSEWLEWIPDTLLPGRRGANFKDFSEQEQTLLIKVAKKNLEDAGAKDVRAFRAGNYGADINTLKALSNNGMDYDTSYNFCYLQSDCGFRLAAPLLQPQKMCGVLEIPVTYFRDMPSHNRHVQITACSIHEMKEVLLQAWTQQWNSVVIVSHGFELIRRARDATDRSRPDYLVIRRFDQLCAFLAEHRDKFRTVGFADVEPEKVLLRGHIAPLRSSPIATSRRIVEQFRRRLIRT